MFRRLNLAFVWSGVVPVSVGLPSDNSTVCHGKSPLKEYGFIIIYHWNTWFTGHAHPLSMAICNKNCQMVFAREYKQNYILIVCPLSTRFMKNPGVWLVQASWWLATLDSLKHVEGIPRFRCRRGRLARGGKMVNFVWGPGVLFHSFSIYIYICIYIYMYIYIYVYMEQTHKKKTQVPEFDKYHLEINHIQLISVQNPKWHPLILADWFGIRDSNHELKHIPQQSRQFLILWSLLKVHQSQMMSGFCSPGFRVDLTLVPIGSIYAIYGNIYHQHTPNVSMYTIHGSYGVC